MIDCKNTLKGHTMQLTQRLARRFLGPLFTALLVSACGGGGGGDAGTPPPSTGPTCTPAAAPPAGSTAPQVTLAINNGAGVSGNIVITLDAVSTPLTVANFLAYVNAGFYNNTVFHRHGRTSSLGTFVLQGGGYAAPVTSAARFPAPKATNAPIALEVGRGLSNVCYSVAMARTSAPNSATSEFFINTTDNVFLNTSDGGYAVFGNITAGTALVNAMVAATCNFSSANFALSSPDCVPEPNLVIVSAIRTR